MVVCEGFAPVSHREVGIYFLSRAELFAGLLPSEAVKDRYSTKEVLLRFTTR